MPILEHLQPQAVFAQFEQLCAIPHGSGNTKAISDYLVRFAAARGLRHIQDEYNNVIIFCPGTPGYEAAAPVILQGHMDMVCETAPDCAKDMTSEGLDLFVNGDTIGARGTTLGGDDGIAVAMALAILDADDIPHPPLEVVLTVDEETGLTGAFGLGEGMLTGKYLVNLDSEDEGEIFIGCAGGLDTLGTFHYTPEPAPAGLVWFRIHLFGLKGGHSGDDIEKGRGNSNKLLNRYLSYGTAAFALRLADFNGGNLRNAIPREASALFGVPVEYVKPMLAYFETYKADVLAEYAVTEPTFEITLAEEQAPAEVVDLATQRRLLDAICGLPNGVLAMSHAVEGLVETSTNLASVKFPERGVIVVTTSQRSSVGSARDEAAASVEAVLRLAGADVIHSDGYPGWNPNPDSYLLRLTEKTYQDLFDQAPKVRAIHAGLECGLFLEKYPHLEMVSFGPTLRGVHSPDERLEIATVDKFWKLLSGVISAIEKQ